MNGELAGRTALVTGSSRGIGLAVAQLFAEQGADLVLVARNRERLEAAAKKIADTIGRRPALVFGDITSAETAERAVVEALSKFGRLDVLANVAGWYPTARIEETQDGDFRETIDSNLYATFAMCRAALPTLRESQGSVVNMSSTAARFPTPGLAAYSASKAGIEGFSRAMAAEAAPDVRVNVVSAGPTLTDSVRALMLSDTTGAVAAVTAQLPLGRLAEPREIAEVFLFLASPRATVITGQVIQANCGGHMA
ncbi:SDR family oxidoreductase [Novosphingobium sp. PS1R-30]|uniref:SDR family oxidoreductase n=1 Tax=Novosphingobium anseongense TaxID=3133436 RepID=A0ABU8S0Q1_9SPHN